MEETVNCSVYETVRTGGDGKGSGTVKPEDMALLQERLFEILEYFDEFCMENGISYSLAGGTCIGAVRDHDFIPWDDDLDVAVLRKDYDRLFDLWEKKGDKERFSLYRTTDSFCAYVPIGIMRNNRTTFIRHFEAGLEDRNLGVKIDIEPMDEIPDNPLKRKIQFYFAHFYVLFLTERNASVINRPRKRVAMHVLKLVKSRKLRRLILKVSEKQVKKYNGTGCKKVAINGLGFERYRSDIAEPTRMLFHGKYFNVPAAYDDFLKRGYGDYMSKPPVEKRVPRDVPEYYDLNTPYSEYLAQKKKCDPACK